MGKTAIVKIMERAAGRPVKVGERVWCNIDLASARDFGGANCVLQFEEEMGKDAKVWDPDKVAFTFDLQAPSHSEKVSNNQKIIREFAKRQGIKYLFDINHGIGQHVMLEAGLIKPGDVVLGTDSHMNLLGAVGAFATGVGNSDVAAAYINGINWFRVPETMKIEVTGEFKKGVCMRDLLTYIVGDLGAGGMDFLAVEFTGDTIEKASLSERITLCSMVTEMSGKVPLIMPNGEVLDWMVSRAGEEVIERIKMLSADPDATYYKVLHYDVSKLEPMVSCPDTPDNVKRVRKIEGTKVDQVHIGSCSNGRFEDIEAAYQILMAGGGTVHPEVRTIITPSTREVQIQCVKAGMIEKFLEAGIVFTNPTCSLCTAEHYGALPSGDIGCSTTNRNFLGKVGKGSHTYLMSPMTAMATALKGVITDPRNILEG
ncbi:3-isopropylmalate dehydratase large subunit [Geosporobacter ferrireducens]|uniref:3-isopropylmalate dehydratase large subunit n=1 Tax=Geosporobacter ferrireducens TaxID=1424294 RepID=UPI00139C4169|nr:aconitase/3-isopropylmalate dehydratase large subunit family protein [Geosporobacter ferrireducens]MTI56598.1 homoaconitate hydratase family protein [Geosporobacter ferrireducens]